MAFYQRSLVNISGNGTNTYSNTSGHFTATPTSGTKNIVLTGLPFTLTPKNVVMGVIEKIASDGTVSILDLSKVTVANDVITLGNETNFADGDTVLVLLYGPDKPLDIALVNTTITDTLQVAATAATVDITISDYTKLHLTAAAPSGTLTFGTPSFGDTVSISGLPTEADNKTFTMHDASTLTAATPSGTITFGSPSDNSTVVLTGLPTDGNKIFTKKTAVVETTAVQSAPIIFGTPSDNQTVTVNTTETRTFTKKTATALTAATASGQLDFGTPSDGDTIIFSNLPTNGNVTFTKATSVTATKATPSNSGEIVVANFADNDTLVLTGFFTPTDNKTYTKKTATVLTAATPSGVITYGTPSNGSTMVFANLPNAGGTKTFTKVASDPDLNEFTNITELTYLIQTLTDVNASNDGTDITLTVATSGAAMNSATITGTSSYSGLSITFSGGLDTYNLRTDEFETAVQLNTLLNNLNDLDCVNNAGILSVTMHNTGADYNSATLTGTGTYNSLSIVFSGGLDAYVLATDEFETINNLHTLIGVLVDVNSTIDGTHIDIGVDTQGTLMNSATITGTGAYSALNITFSGGIDLYELGVNEFETIAQLEALIEACPGLNSAVDNDHIDLTVTTAGSAPNSWTIGGTAGYIVTFSGGADTYNLGATEFETADGLATLINGLTDINASNNAGTITLTVVTEGSTMNDATVTGTSSYSALSIIFSGGLDLHLHGPNEFETIAELTALFNGLTDINATDNGTTITFTVPTKGTGMNDVVIEGTGTFSALDITFSGGVDAAVLTVGVATITETTDWNSITSNNQAATNLASVINALSTVNASATDNIITVTAAVVGVGGEGINLTTSNPTYLTLSHSHLQNSSYVFTGLLSTAPIFTSTGVFATPGSGAVSFTREIFLNEVETAELVQASGDYFIDYRSGYFKVFTPNNQSNTSVATYKVKKLLMS